MPVSYTSQLKKHRYFKIFRKVCLGALTYYIITRYEVQRGRGYIL